MRCKVCRGYLACKLRCGLSPGINALEQRLARSRIRGFRSKFQQSGPNHTGNPKPKTLNSQGPQTWETFPQGLSCCRVPANLLRISWDLAALVTEVMTRSIIPLTGLIKLSSITCSFYKVITPVTISICLIP